ncbi:hypothetical protein [Fusobacterium necrophorum]|uniref:hypothetical protein n=1 Tax=Fusobacterium necrophorum TaxID=859 RepID=UPI00254EF233|nr:hypothetical protein [Fusobacterium necrophorum]MDK4524978.1 hypothetical protein [Fusobacterium necrophorum]
MEKEKVLEIEFIPIWDKWVWRITKNELFNLYNRVQEYENKSLRLKLKKECKNSIFMYSFVLDDYKETLNFTLLFESEKERLEEFVKHINKKYGKPKCWRAKYGERYYYIDCCAYVQFATEHNTTTDNRLYELGNYFQTREQAEKALKKVKKAYQEVVENE